MQEGVGHRDYRRLCQHPWLAPGCDTFIAHLGEPGNQRHPLSNEMGPLAATHHTTSHHITFSPPSPSPLAIPTHQAEEVALAEQLARAQDAVHAALLDNINTAAALGVLVDLVGHVNNYLADKVGWGRGPWGLSGRGGYRKGRGSCAGRGHVDGSCLAETVRWVGGGAEDCGEGLIRKIDQRGSDQSTRIRSGAGHRRPPLNLPVLCHAACRATHAAPTDCCAVRQGPLCGASPGAAADQGGRLRDAHPLNVRHHRGASGQVRAGSGVGRVAALDYAGAGNYMCIANLPLLMKQRDRWF